MGQLVACPFCRQLFPPGEASKCPDCGLALQDMGKLPPSYEALLEDPLEVVPPHMERLPWTYAGRNRALLMAIAIAGLVGFFVPWIHETAPELRVLSGFDLAKIRGFYWAPAIAWFVTLPLVASRRSIYKMRGARVAVAFLAAIALITITMLLGNPPASSAHRIVRIQWCWGVYFSGVTALAGVVASIGFGGQLDDLPTTRKRRGDEVLH